LLLHNQKAYDFETWHEASGNEALHSFKAGNLRHSHVTKTSKQTIIAAKSKKKVSTSGKVSRVFHHFPSFMKKIALPAYETNFSLLIFGYPIV
ncbi:MAG: hypothetical protein JAY84_18785, partial [Candidatus Thiodiazotropha taylori]|nr:hypothetical protein [Candidatus Thiodiazotropha taylori]